MEEAKKRIRHWISGMLDLTNLGLTELPELPEGIQRVYCSANSLTTLPNTLPKSLTLLDCSHNRLTRLPDTLPAGLRDLYCDNNQLLSLPDTLPPALTSFFCNSNRLTTLPDTLPADLTTLYCSHNQLTTLPKTLPADLRQFWCANNAFPDRDNDEKLYEYIFRINTIAEAASKERIVTRCALYFEELAQKVWHPSRVERLMLAGVDMEEM